MSEPQIIITDKYGELRVVQGYHEAPRLVFLLENGAYVSDTGRPIENEQELREAIPAEYLPPALEWLQHRDDTPAGQPRKILVLPNGSLVFEDGNPVENIQDIIAFFEPGPFREAALIAFADKLAAERDAKAGLPPKKVEKPQPPPAKTAKKTAGKGPSKKAKRPAPKRPVAPPPAAGEQPPAW